MTWVSCDIHYLRIKIVSTVLLLLINCGKLVTLDAKYKHIPQIGTKIGNAWSKVGIYAG